MSKNECNPCDIDIQSLEEKNAAAVTQPTVYSNEAGELTIDAIPFLEEQYAESLVENLDTNAFEILLRKFGDDTVNDIVNGLNNFLNSKNVVISSSQYPYLYDRLVLPKPITGIECAQFMQDYLYTPTSIGRAQKNDIPKLLRNLNDFFNGSWIQSLMGGFCGTIGNIFGAAMALFDMVGRIGDAINSALSAIQKLRNLKDPLRAAFEKIKVQALIEAIKKKVTDALKEVWRSVQDAVDNFGLSDLFSDIEENQAKGTNPSVKQRIITEKNKIKEILKDENRDTFLKKVEGLIDYAIERFANPSLKAVELLVYRMCGFAVNIEEMLKNLKRPLETFNEDTKDSEEQIKKASAQTTAEAVKNGAVRMDDETRREGINNMRERCKENCEKAGVEADENGEPPTVIETDPPTSAEIDGIPTWEQLIKGPVNNLKVDPGSNMATQIGSIAWSDRYVPMEAKVKLMKLAEAWGSTLTIISAYRPPKYNTKVGGKQRSLHLKGVAFDVTFSGSSSRRRQFEFAELARKQGWNAAGFYPGKGFVHVDIGGTIPGYEDKRPKKQFVTWPKTLRDQYHDWRKNK